MLCALDLESVNAASLPAQSAAEARALDAAAVAELGLPSIVLMENAARACAQFVLDRLGPGERVLILAGSGNNGGDGLAMARLLSPRASVALLAEPKPDRAPDAATQLAVLRAAGQHPTLAAQAPELELLARDATIVVDALLGTGLESAPRGLAADWIEWVNDSARRVLAVDLPSGLSSDDGTAFDPCVRADWTISFARPKRGLLCGDGPAQTGEVLVASIGLPEDWVRARESPREPRT